MSKILAIACDEHFDLLRAEDAPEHGQSLGSYRVLARDGQEEQRDKYRVSQASVAAWDISDEFDVNNMTGLLHLVETITERQTDAATGVYSDDPALAAKVAALLDVPVLDRHPAEAGEA